MIDFLKKEGGKKEDHLDLLLSKASHDWQRQSSPLEAVRFMVIESFDMPFADDIDFPSWHSRQRQFHNAPEDTENLSSLAARMIDAQRILVQHPEIDPESIDIGIDADKTLVIDFKLKNGASLQGVRPTEEVASEEVARL